MPVSFYHDNKKRILYGAISGRFTIEELTGAMAGIISSAEFPPDANTLWDCNEMDHAMIDMKLLNHIIALRKRSPERGNARLALVLDKEMAKGLARLYEKLSVGLPQQIQTFTTRDEAESWLSS
ncbi:MAG: STAS/SEC14 domain-containing protein [Gammaproteobacteria bacterium]|nr:STAS/SEC14 domain-containing protein [Gammaproteobacteria bacterium]